MAAVLACGPGSALSHRNAAAHLSLLPYAGPRVHVTAVAAASRPGIVVHRVKQLRDDDRTMLEGIEVTSVARTLLDIAPLVRPDQLERAIEAAERQGAFDLRALERVMCPRRPGSAALRSALHGYRDPGLTRSEFERRFARMCRESGVPPPAMNIWIGDQEVDAAWEDAKVAVLLDSWEFHRTRAAFEDDRRRQAALQVRGYHVLPITDRRFVDDAGAVIDAVRALLSA